VGEAIGETLPLALGIALNPVSIIAVILMLVSPRGRVNGVAFVLGWIVGLAVVGVVGLLLVSPADAHEDDGPAAWVSLLMLVLGAAMLVLALGQWRRRPRGGEETEPPAWMGAVDGFGVAKAGGTGVVLAAANPKNLLLAASAIATIVGATSTAGQQAAAYALFTVVGSLGVAVPAGVAIVLGTRSEAMLLGLRDWLARNAAVIMTVLMLVIGTVLIGDGIAGLTA
jgi:threonine/homoserine/homoserine lactone efflux protein